MYNEHILKKYDFWQLWNPDILFLIILAGLVYVLITGQLRHLFLKSTPVEIRRKVSFIAGLIMLYFAMGSPLHLIGHDFLFSAHMLEQAIVYFVVPPLLLFGLPNWLVAYRKLVYLNQVSRIILHPLTALLAFNALFSFYHLPPIFDKVNINEIFHLLTHTILMLSAILMWRTIIFPLSREKQLSELHKIGYLIANTLLLYPACALIIFAGQSLYETYQEVPILITYLPLLHDQQLGGIIMKFVQEGVFITAIAFLFFKWYRKENNDCVG